MPLRQVDFYAVECDSCECDFAEMEPDRKIVIAKAERAGWHIIRCGDDWIQSVLCPKCAKHQEAAEYTAKHLVEHLEASTAEPPLDKSGRISCPVCGRLVKGYVPTGGDGGAMRPYRHINPETGHWCRGRFHAVELE